VKSCRGSSVRIAMTTACWCDFSTRSYSFPRRSQQQDVVARPLMSEDAAQLPWPTSAASQQQQQQFQQQQLARGRSASPRLTSSESRQLQAACSAAAAAADRDAKLPLPAALAGSPGVPDWRSAAALAQHQTQVASMQRDMLLELPPTLPLPDGEEFPHSANGLHIRTRDQEREIYQTCIRPPPNRTVSRRQLSPPLPPPASSAAGRLVTNCTNCTNCTGGSRPPSDDSDEDD